MRHYFTFDKMVGIVQDAFLSHLQAAILHIITGLTSHE